MIKRGAGRQALIDATAAVLAEGGDVQVKEIAAAAGVSHTLIYRHFPDGGKEELIAEAYAKLFRGMTEPDVDRIFELIDERGLEVAPIAEFLRTVIGRRREGVRWLRLEALVESRSNPYLAERLELVRLDLIHGLLRRIEALTPAAGNDRIAAISILAQAIPVGVTAVAGSRVSRRVKDELAFLWAETIVHAVRLKDSDAS